MGIRIHCKKIGADSITSCAAGLRECYAGLATGRRYFILLRFPLVTRNPEQLKVACANLLGACPLNYLSANYEAIPRPHKFLVGECPAVNLCF
jgi:hypothetical protein